MGKAIYEGIGGVARKVKNVYEGISGVARKAKAGWIGVSGVARQFFASAYEFYNYGSNPAGMKSTFSTALPITFNSTYMSVTYTSNGGYTSGSYGDEFSWPIESAAISDLTSLNDYTKFVLVVDTGGREAKYYNLKCGFSFDIQDGYPALAVSSVTPAVVSGEQRIEIPLTDTLKTNFATAYASSTTKNVYLKFSHLYKTKTVENDGSSDEHYYYYRPLDIYYIGLE